MTIGIRKPGEFCWINMLTPRIAAAREFFGALLGWTFVEMPPLGHRVQVGGHDIGGLFDVVSPQTPQGAAPVIGLMVKVEDADAICERVRALGGQAMPAFDIATAGRMAVCHDPNGAQFDVWEPRKMTGTEVDGGLPGAPTWFETLTTNVDRATGFYSKLFGWTPETTPIEGGAYTTFKLGGAPVAGLMQITPEMGDLRPHWGTYFAAADVDASARRAVELGAGLCVPPRDLPGVGRFCGIISPQGVTFYLIQYRR